MSKCVICIDISFNIFTISWNKFQRKLGFLQNRENSDLIFQIEYFTGNFFLEKLQVKILLISQHNFAYLLLAFILLFNLDNKIAILFSQ